VRGLLAAALVTTACASSGTPAGSTAVQSGSGAPPGAAAGSAPVALIPVNASYSGLAASQAPVGVGVEAGIFARHGLDVTAQYIASSPQSTAALLSGEIDVSVVGGQGVLAAALSGADTTIIGGMNNQLNGGVVAVPGLRTADDLRGKRIAMSRRGSNPYYLMRLSALRLGLDPDQDVIGIQTNSVVNSVEALRGGAVEAAALSPPLDRAMLGEGFASVFDASSAGVKWAATQVAATRGRIEQRPEIFDRFLAGLAESIKRYKADRPYALAVLARYTMADSEEAVAAGYDIEAAALRDDLRPDLAAVQAVLEQIRDEYPAAATAKAADFVDFRFVDRLASGTAPR
jgi:NitT/TauT family transport system substrate-binding protein